MQQARGGGGGNEVTHYSGKVHVRGLLRRVWRPRYLALGDDGYLRYHESIPPIYQQDKYHGPPQNPQHNLLVKHTHRPKTILAILDGARVINPHSVVDQHVGLPSGVHGFVFRGRSVEIRQGGVTGNQSLQKSEAGGALILPSSNDPGASPKPTTTTKAVVNTLFPKGSQRRKTAQALAKNAINPDVLGGFCSTANCDELSRNSSEEEFYQQAEDDETWGRKSQESHGSTGSFQQVDRPGIVQPAMDVSDELGSAPVQVKVSSMQSREYLCAVPTAVEAESWVVALRWAAEHRRRLRYHAPRQRDLGARAQTNGLQLHLETPIEGDGNYPTTTDEPPKTAVAANTSDQANSAATTVSEVDSSAKDSSSKESISSLLIVEQDGWQPEDVEQPEGSSNASEDAVVITSGPDQLKTAKSDNSPTIVMKASRFRLPANAVGGITRFNKNRHNNVHWLPIQLPLPGDSLVLEYEIKLLLLIQSESPSSSQTPISSVEEKTIHKSIKSLIVLVHRLMISFDRDEGDSECSTPQRKGRDQQSFDDVDEALKLLEDCESILLECIDEQSKFVEPSVEAIGTIVDAIAGSVSCAMGSVDAVNDVVNKLAMSPRICRSTIFKDCFRLDNSNDHRGRKLITRATDDIETITKKWRLDKDTLSSSDRTRLYLAAILRHAVAGPALSLATVWTIAKCLISTCRLVSGWTVTISLPAETYSFLLVLTFYVGHAYGMDCRRKRVISHRKRRRSRRGKLANQMSSPSSFADQRAESIMSDEADDESTVVDEEEFDDESEVAVDNEHESLLSSPLPLYPNNGGVTCWSRPDHKIFRVRGKTYLRDRIKIPSAPAIFHCRGVDVWLTENAERNISLSRANCVLGGKLNAEDSFVVNFLLPFANFCAYFTVPPIDTMPPNIAAVWLRFINGDQQYRDSKLKLLPVVVDGPWIVKKAVGPGTAPAVIGRDLPLQYYFREPTSTEKGCYEVDVLVTASAIGRAILNVVKGHTKSVTLAFAFIIEASEELHLPETVLCAFQIHSLHLEHCPKLPWADLSVDNGHH